MNWREGKKKRKTRCKDKEKEEVMRREKNKYKG